MLDQIGSRPTQDAGVHGAFLGSYRAGAACMRELGRLFDEIDAELERWPELSLAPEPPVIRRSPARCMVQVGPVALTVAWLLRAQRTVADGELLVVVWRGVVGTRAPRVFERSDEPVSASSATVLWERVLTVDAISEAGWGWASADAAGEAMPSLALAHQCVDRLRVAYGEASARAG